MTNQNSAEHFTTASQPFHTQDVALAFSLYLAGVPFADPTRPCFNLYDAEILKKLGFRGLTLEQAAQAALDAGKKGEVRYIFARTPQLNDLLEAYKAEQETIKNGEGTAAERLAELLPNGELHPQEPYGTEGQPAHRVTIDESTRLRVAEVILKLRPLFVNMWKDQVPLIRVPNKGDTSKAPGPSGSVIETSPGYRVISLNASEATKNKLRL